MDSRVTEFHCIMPMCNVPSVMKHGILSYERTAKLAHQSVAMQEVQDRRDRKRVTGGLMLHHYANLYFHARNPMMYLRPTHASELCVLRISTAVADLDGVVFADRNAAGDYARFLTPAQWVVLDFDRIYALDWNDQDRFAYFDKKAKKCAEVLVPDKVETKFLTGAYVVDQAAAAQFVALDSGLSVLVNPMLFFR